MLKVLDYNYIVILWTAVLQSIIIKTTINLIYYLINLKFKKNIKK